MHVLKYECAEVFSAVCSYIDTVITHKWLRPVTLHYTTDKGNINVARPAFIRVIVPAGSSSSLDTSLNFAAGAGKGMRSLVSTDLFC